VAISRKTRFSHLQF